MKQYNLLKLTPLFFIVIASCSKNDEFGSIEKSELQFESPFVRLNKIDKRGGILEFGVKNNGNAGLKIKELKLTFPNQFSFHGDEIQGQCNRCSQCISTKCYDTSDPQLPIVVEPDASYTIKIGYSSNIHINCPPLPDYVPEKYKARYCGDLAIETDATNSSEDNSINNGIGRIYFLYDGPVGNVDLNPKRFVFRGAQTGEKQENKVKITNRGESDLTIKGVSSTNAVVKATPDNDNFPIILKPGDTTDFTITVTPGKDLDFDSTVTFNTSAGDQEIYLKVTAEEEKTAVMSLDKSMLSFAQQPSQDFTVTNNGTENLNLTRFEFKKLGKTEIDTAYKVTDSQGNEVKNGSIIIGEKESKTFKVTLPQNSVNRDKLFAKLTIYNSDDSLSSNKEILLTPTDPRGYGRLYPFDFNFAGSSNASHTFVIANDGNEDLEITDFNITSKNNIATSLLSIKDKDGNDISLPLNIEKHSIFTGKIAYTTTSANNFDATLKITSNGISDNYTEDMYRLKRDISIKVRNNSTAQTISVKSQVNAKPNVLVKIPKPTTQIDDCFWFLTARPATSKVFFAWRTQACKEQAPKFHTDETGEYKVTALTLGPGGEEATVAVTSK